MRNLSLTLLGLLASSALAWTPALDEGSAKKVIDAAYNRAAQPLSTLLTIDLTVKDGAFGTGSAAGTAANTAATAASAPEGSTATPAATPSTTPATSPASSPVRVFDGDASCLTNWLQQPGAFDRFGSRPTSVLITGQADELFLQAQQARDNFKNMTVRDALSRKYQLPAGNLKVYVAMNGLVSDKLRDAYNVALRTAAGKIAQPVRRAYTSDWKQTGGLWSGTMVYYFDAAKAGIGANDKVDVLIRTEADTDCAYAVNADLSKFY